MTERQRQTETETDRETETERQTEKQTETKSESIEQTQFTETTIMWRQLNSDPQDLHDSPINPLTSGNSCLQLLLTSSWKATVGE